MMTTTTIAMKPVDEMGYLSGVIDKIKLDIRAKEIAVDAKDSSLTSAERVRLIKDIELLKRELKNATEKRDCISSALRGMTGVI